MGESSARPAKASPDPEDLSGATVGRFLIRARLGAGAMGEVYRAEDSVLKRIVALKRIAPALQADPYFHKRFLKEAERASSLTHPRIAGIFDVLEDPNGTFLVMEYVEGQTLRQRISQPLDVEEFLRIAEQCAEALVGAHEKHIVHCDIKPENILLTSSGDVKVLDFGVAKRLPEASDAASKATQAETQLSVGGTFLYMAPEVLLERAIDPRSDLFSLGVVFYEALSGRHPFRSGSPTATMSRILHEPPTPLSEANHEVPQGLSQIVERLLAKQPAARYATAGELLGALQAFRRGEGLATVPSVPSIPAGRRWKTAAIAVFSLFLLGALAVALPAPRRWIVERLRLSTIPNERHLAVLPFDVVGGDAQSRAFADGLTETLTVRLARFTKTGNLQVVPASSIRSERVTDTEKARQELGVNLVLEGSLHQQSDKVRVTCSLVDARTRRVIEAATITEPLADPFAMEDHVVDSIVQMLGLEAQPQEWPARTARGTTSASAYDFYLQGRGYLQNYDKPENLDSAIRVFEQALSSDPNYAPAYAGLGDAYWWKYHYRNETRWVEASRKACERAAALNAKLPEAHTCLGTLYNGTGNYEQAATAFRAALEEDPLNDDAYRGLGGAYQKLGKPAEAEQTYQKAISIRPHYHAGYTALAVFYWRRGRLADAAKMFEQATQLTPDSFQAHSNLGAIYLLQGRYNEAITTFERSIALRPTAEAYSNLATGYFSLRQFEGAATTYERALVTNASDFLMWGNLGEAYYWTEGKRGQSEGAFRKAIELANEKLSVNPRDQYVLADLAYYHAMLGEKRPAMDYLQRALAQAPKDSDVQFKAALVNARFGDTQRSLEWLVKARASGVSASSVRDNPMFDPLRQNPVYQRLSKNQ